MKEESKILDFVKNWWEFLTKFLCGFYFYLIKIEKCLFSFLGNLTPLFFVFSIGLFSCYQADSVTSLSAFHRVTLDVFGVILILISIIFYIIGIHSFYLKIKKINIYCSNIYSKITFFIIVFFLTLVFFISAFLNFGLIFNAIYVR